jgi:hypothetical protein
VGTWGSDNMRYEMNNFRDTGRLSASVTDAFPRFVTVGNRRAEGPKSAETQGK